MLTPHAAQQSQQQKASQLTGDSTKSPTVRFPVPQGFSFCGSVTSDANHPRLAYQDDMAPQTHCVSFAAKTVIGSTQASALINNPLHVPPQTTTLRTIKRLSSVPLGNLPSIPLHNEPFASIHNALSTSTPITPLFATLDGPRSTQFHPNN